MLYPLNRELRLQIARMVKRGNEGHIPSSYSIVDIIEHLYSHVLRHKPTQPDWADRDFFILSKGHGCAALYVVMHKHGYLTDRDLNEYGKPYGILGGHPDVTRVPGVEASTGSLGHGFLTAIGIALGHKIKKRENRVFALLGDGECQEGTIWEGANIATNRQLSHLCTIVDWNGSAAQLMPLDRLPEKWQAFGWDVKVVDGHSQAELHDCFSSLCWSEGSPPKCVIAKTVKGKGVSFVEGHGRWHHRIPTNDEMIAIENELK